MSDRVFAARSLDVAEAVLRVAVDTGTTTTTMKNYSSLPVRRREVQVDISQTDNVDGLLVLRHRRV